MTNLASSVLLCAVAGKKLNEAELAFYSKNPPAGFTLFTRNIDSDFRSLNNLTSSLQNLLPTIASPFFIAIDQEGGRVRRLKDPFPNPGPAMLWQNGEHDKTALIEIRKKSKEIAEQLRSLGINTNFAPVVDVLTEENNIAIGDRAFGREPEKVINRAQAFILGHQDAGVLSCLKHFPGQGAAIADTHLSESVVNLSVDELSQIHLLPFKYLLSTSMIMVSHCVYPSLDKSPASISKKIISDMLVGEFKYSGLILSDDFNMNAISQDEELWQDLIIEALVAGNHLVLVCEHLDRCRLASERISRELKKSSAFAKLIEDKVTLINKLRRELNHT